MIGFSVPFDFGYDFPAGAWLLFFIFPLLFLLYSLFQHRKKSLNNFATLDVQEKVFIKRSFKIFLAKALACLLAWIFLVLSFMQPKGGAHYPEEYSLGETSKAEGKKPLPQEVIFLFDTSASMGIADSRNGLSRLEFGKEIVDQIVAKLQGDQASLYAFTSQVTPLSPPTLDYLFVRLVNRSITLNEGGVPGTNFSEALKLIQDKFLKNSSQKLKTLIILSDGGDTSLESLTGKEKNEAVRSLLDLLGDPNNSHLQVFTIGLGSLSGSEVPHVEYEGKKVVSKLQQDLLEKLALRGNGQFFLADQYTSISLAQEIVSKMRTQKKNSIEKKLTPISEGSSSKVIFNLYYQIPLGLALLLLSFILLWPDRELKS